jgi:hypothetical protein
MAYLNKMQFAGNVIMVEDYHSYRYQSELNNERGRAKKKNKTTEQQAAVNARRSSMNIILLAMENFKKGDYWIRLSYFAGQRPKDIDAAHKNITSLFKKLKRKCKELFYIAVTEEGSHGGLHHHLLLPSWFDINMLIDLWDGGVHVKATYSSELSHLASYLTKGELDDTLPSEERDEAHHKGIKNKKITHSRNLRKPVVKIKKVKADSWREEIHTKKINGVVYEVKPGSMVTGFTSDGFPYRRYILIRRQKIHADGVAKNLKSEVVRI